MGISSTKLLSDAPKTIVGLELWLPLNGVNVSSRKCDSRNALRSVRREWPSGADDGRPKGVNEMTREERAEKKRIVQSLGEAFAALPEAKREFLIGYAEGVAAMKAKYEQDEEKKAG